MSAKKLAKRGGKPTVCTVERIEKLLVDVSSGIPIRLAAARVGIGKTAFYRWAAIEANADRLAGARATLAEAGITALKSALHPSGVAKSDNWEFLLERLLPDEFGVKAVSPTIEISQQTNVQANTFVLDRATLEGLQRRSDLALAATQKTK